MSDSICEFYKNHPAMRQKYFELNGWTHVTHYENGDGTFSPFLCKPDLVGCPEGGVRVSSIRKVKAWAKEYAPELTWINS